MVTVQQDEWTEEKCLELIREFRSRPVLWDPKHEHFYKKTVKPTAWEEIGQTLGMPPEATKHKMIVLMSSFRREKSKILHSIKAGDTPDKMYKSTWFGFKDMAFLLDKDTERKRQLDESADDSDAVSDDNVDNIKINILRHAASTTKRYREKKRLRISEDINKELAKMLNKQAHRQTDEEEVAPVDIPTPSIAPGSSVSWANAYPRVDQPSEAEEEIRSFTNFIANKMKKYTETTKNAVQQAICEIIFKADQNKYEEVEVVNKRKENDPLVFRGTIIKTDYDSD